MNSKDTCALLYPKFFDCPAKIFSEDAHACVGAYIAYNGVGLYGKLCCRDNGCHSTTATPTPPTR